MAWSVPGPPAGSGAAGVRRAGAAAADGTAVAASTAQRSKASPVTLRRMGGLLFVDGTLGNVGADTSDVNGGNEGFPRPSWDVRRSLIR
ncbi:hypothetical protein GCM10010252_40130 [Streptomyces aureoverticillatus]|nr:hypothetical protein GCM10010252_40130 [Streptomyces aureoverticillatus]